MPGMYGDLREIPLTLNPSNSSVPSGCSSSRDRSPRCSYQINLQLSFDYSCKVEYQDFALRGRVLHCSLLKVMSRSSGRSSLMKRNFINCKNSRASL